MVKLERAREAFEPGTSFPLAPKRSEVLFAWFPKSTLYERMTDEASAALLRQERPAFVNSMGRFTAGVHHAFCDVTLAAQVGKEYNLRQLLSSEDVLLLFESLFPTARRVPVPFRPDKLDLTYVPDGVLVEKDGEKWRIISFCEYTLREGGKHFRDKYKCFKRLKGYFPHVFPETTTLLFVVPRELALLRSEVPKGVSFCETSYTHAELLTYINSLYKAFQANVLTGQGLEELSAEEQQRRIAARLAEQALRFLHLKKVDGLTRQWREWAKKHASLIEEVRGNR